MAKADVLSLLLSYRTTSVLTEISINQSTNQSDVSAQRYRVRIHDLILLTIFNYYTSN